MIRPSWIIGSAINRVCLSLLISNVLLVTAQESVETDRMVTNKNMEITYRIVETGSNFDLNCTTTAQLKPKNTNRLEWQLPQNTGWWDFYETKKDDKEYFHHYFITPEKITPTQNRSVTTEIRLQNQTILSTLTITKATFRDTGSYICFTRDNTGKIVQIKEQHIFVKDPNLLFVPPTSTNNIRQVVVGFSSQPNFTIGCLPTHPSIQIELIRPSSTFPSEEKIIANSNNGGNSSIDSNWSFKPFTGFVCQNCVTSSLVGHYLCRATSPQSVVTTIYTDFKIEVYGVEVVPSSREQLVRAGASFEMTCRGRKPQKSEGEVNESEMRPVFSTLINPLPGKPQITERKSIEENLGLIYTYNIKWESIPIEASGTYQCRDSLNATYPPWQIRLNVSFDINHLLAVGHTQNPALFREYSAILNGYFSTSSSSMLLIGRQTYYRNKGNNFTIECIGPQTPVYRQWFKPSRENDNEFFQKNRVKPLGERWMTTDDILPTLTVINASYLDTGYYYCFNTYKFEKLYDLDFIFVHDSQNLILPPVLRRIGDKNELRVAVPYGEQHVPIGCGPTHPDIQVFLNHRKTAGDKFKVIASSLTSKDEENNWLFSPYDGFILNAVELWEMKGEYVCEAKWPNQTTIANVTDKFEIKVIGMEIVSSKERKPIYEGDELTLTCRTRKEDAVKLSWRWFPQGTESNSYKNGIEIHNTTGLLAVGMAGSLPRITEETSEEECPPSIGKCQIQKLQWGRISLGVAGIYQCFDVSVLNIPVKNISITVLSLNFPSIYGESLLVLKEKLNEKIKLVCNGFNFSLPILPKVQWFIVPTSKVINATITTALEEIRTSSKFTIHTNSSADETTSELIIHQVDTDIRVQCLFSNGKGSAKKEFIINVEQKSLSKGQIAAIVIAIIVVIAVVIIIVRLKFVRSIRRQKRRYQELVNNRLRLLEGNVEQINPDKPIEDQVGCLPYDHKYEFPINQLILGKQLGVGQFGRVVQAEAIGIGPSGENKTGAVKMVKTETDNTALSSLASELKILIHLGSHLNVVSLLGACTKNLKKGELLVIVEYCRYGSLKDFLFSNRCNFILKESVDDVDYSITQQHFDINTASPSVKLNYVNVQLENQQVIEPYVLFADDRNEETFSKKSTVCLNDLMKWTFQTACGMNYVSKRKVMHGDLAARNLLLADDGVVKIADFGLSRNVYQNCDYKKQGEEALPFRWMAIESLIDHVFSSKSDVWSFGVTTWEIFTLCQQPYPKITDYVGLIEFLQNGHRMEKPELAPDVIGEIMINCWKQNPNDRMTFDQLEKTLGQLVDEGTRQHFASGKKPKETVANSYVQLQTKSKKVCENGYVNMSCQPENEIVSQKE